MRLLPYGDRALLVELADAAAVVSAAGLVRDHADAPAVLADVVPGARTVLLVARPGVPRERLQAVVPSEEALLAATQQQFRWGQTGQEGAVEIPVTYDGPDLAEVAALTGLTEAEVVAAHTGTPWRVAFGGFAPGFAYLVGGDERLRAPRRSTPRTSVPAGAVGLAGEFSGVYPRSSPGGWQLIGRTDVPMWDLDRDPPAVLAAGVAVRFIDADSAR